MVLNPFDPAAPDVSQKRPPVKPQCTVPRRGIFLKFGACLVWCLNDLSAAQKMLHSRKWMKHGYEWIWFIEMKRGWLKQPQASEFLFCKADFMQAHMYKESWKRKTCVCEWYQGIYACMFFCVTLAVFMPASLIVWTSQWHQSTSARLSRAF